MYSVLIIKASGEVYSSSRDEPAYTFDSRTSLVDQAASVLAEVLDATGAVRRGPITL